MGSSVPDKQGMFVPLEYFKLKISPLFRVYNVHLFRFTHLTKSVCTEIFSNAINNDEFIKKLEIN